MIHKLIHWAVDNALIVLLLPWRSWVSAATAFVHVNGRSLPRSGAGDRRSHRQVPGASAEEVERQVTIPLEVTLAGMPGLKYTRSKSLFGLSHLRNQFEYGSIFTRRVRKSSIACNSSTDCPTAWCRPFRHKAPPEKSCGTRFGARSTPQVTIFIL